MRITHKVAEKAGEEIKQVFISKARTMADAYERMPGDLAVAISCKWKPTDEQEAIGADIGISFKVDECRQKQTYKFTDGKFGPLFDRENMTGLKKILFRDFGDLAQEMETSARERKHQTQEKAETAQAQGEASAEEPKPQEQAEGKPDDAKPDEKMGLYDLSVEDIKKIAIAAQAKMITTIVSKLNKGESLNDIESKRLENFIAENRCKKPEKAPDPCEGCQYHKGMPNPKRGVRVAGVSGKCTRDGGPCYRVKEWLEEQKPERKPKPKAKPKAKPQASQKGKSGLNYNVE